MFSMYQLSLVLVSVLGACKAQMDQATAIAYLTQYNYMGGNSPDSKMASLSDAEALPMAIENFQVMSGLNVTGVLDKPTMAKMMMPRCGVKDIMNMEDTIGGGKRKKRYALQGGRWPKTSLTYRMRNYTPDMSRTDVDKEIRRAFDVWEMVTPLRFTKISSTPDIDILFASGNHGDGNAFDGRGGTLAHAYFPMYGGDSHFDESELWTLRTTRGVNLFQVAAHEFGHALGLGHSSVQTALMAPFYQGYQASFTLDQDDVDGIQQLYGKPRTATTTTTRAPRRTTTRSSRTTRRPAITTTTTRPNVPDIQRVCDAGRFDTITKHTVEGRQRIYAFYKDLYMEIKDGSIAPGYPRKISQDWSGLPDDIDTAIYYKAEYRTYYSWTDRRVYQQQTAPDRTYFFKGGLYWRFENKKPLSGYPRSISRYWGGLPNNMDASFEWTYNGRKYFMKGDNYYRLNNDVYNVRVDPYYPRELTVWDRTLTRLDSALQTGGSTYFFVGKQYYKYDDTNFNLNKQGYPRSISKDWLGCDELLKIVNTAEQDMINSAPGVGCSGLTLVLSTVMVSIMSVLLH